MPNGQRIITIKQENDGITIPLHKDKTTQNNSHSLEPFIFIIEELA